MEQISKDSFFLLNISRKLQRRGRYYEIIEFMKPYFVIIDPSYTNEFDGHYLLYDDSLGEAATSLGFKVKILGNVMCMSGNVKANMEVYNFFQFDVWSRNELGDSVSEISVKNQYIKCMDFIEDEISNDCKKILFYPNVTHLHANTILETAISNSELGTFVLMFRYQFEVYLSFFEHLRKSLNELTHIKFITDSEILRDQFNKYIDKELFTCINVPLLQTLDVQSEKISNEVIRIGTLGNPRAEKGFNKIVDFIGIVKSRNKKIEFDLQLANPSEDAARSVMKIKKLSKNIVTHNKSLTNKQYLERLKSLDLILLPYDQNVYHGRTSSALIESRLNAKPVVVLENTWLANEVRRFGGGLILRSNNKYRISKAVNKILKEFSKYKMQAKIAQEFTESINNTKHVFTQIIQTTLRVNDKKAVVIYPWSDRDIYSSGAGSRLISIEDYLIKCGYKVEIFIPNSRLEMSAAGSPIKNIRINVNSSDDIHTDLHTCKVLPKENDELNKSINSADLIIFECTHLYLPVTNAFNLREDQRVAVVSHDLLQSSSNNEQLLSLQEKCLQAKHSYSISRSETEFWNNLGCKVTFSPTKVMTSNSSLTEIELSAIARKFLGIELDKDKKLIVFVGSLFGPNLDALNEIKKMSEFAYNKNSQLHFVVIGNVHEEFKGKNITCLGKVNSVALEAILKHCNLAIAPILSGTGVAIKILDYLSYGIPVLTTKLGTRGLEDLSNRKNLFVIDQYLDHIDFFDKIESTLNLIESNAINNSQEKLDDRNIFPFDFCKPIVDAKQDPIEWKDTRQNLILRQDFTQESDKSDNSNFVSLLKEITSSQLSIEDKIWISFWLDKTRTIERPLDAFVLSLTKIDEVYCALYEVYPFSTDVVPLSGTWILEVLENMKNTMDPALQDFLYKFSGRISIEKQSIIHNKLKTKSLRPKTSLKTVLLRIIGRETARKIMGNIHSPVLRSIVRRLLNFKV